MFNIINKLRKKIHARTKVESGMTLIEVVIAFLIIAIVSTVLVRGTITAVNTMRINKSKTEALAIANEKIEIIKAIDYSEIKVTDEDDEDNPWMSYYSELPEVEGEFDLTYEVIWVDAGIEGIVDIYKQLKVSVFGGYMTIPVDVITQFYPPVGEEASIGNIYPPPDNLTIEEPEVVPRKVILDWEAPDTDKIISRYNIYRDGEFLAYSLDSFTYYYDYPENNLEYTYHVTAVYEGDIESVNSNTVTTGVPFVYPPPENLGITSYSGGNDSSRTVHLSWTVPDTELTIVEYQIYRDVELIGVSIPTDLFFENIIGAADYQFHVKALYEDNNLGESSNSVNTIYPIPPQNLEITGYSSNGKTVYLAWSAPNTEAIIVEYQVYRDGGLVGTTTDLAYENYIDRTDYTFYIKALYEIDNLSDPSNSETTN